MTKENGEKCSGVSLIFFEEVKDINICHAVHTLQKMYTTCLVAETNMSESDIKEMLNRNVNVYLSAEEAVKLGIADIII